MDLFDLTGKTALITGASSGLGWRFAETLSNAGAKVIITARRMDLLQKLGDQIGPSAIPLIMDVSNRESISNALTQCGEKIDIVINNAGIWKATPIFENGEENAFEDIIQTNLLGPWYVTKTVANHMKKNGIEGSIINIASISGDRVPSEGYTGHAASKAGLIQMTRALVGELSKYKIRINSILPGLFRTAMVSDEHAESVAKINPLGFVAKPNDLDGAILFLASNKASRYVTGSCITVDGGLSWGGNK